MERRLARLATDTAALLASVKPAQVYCESPFVGRFPKATIGLARVGGVILAECGRAGLPVEHATPPEVKRAVGLKGNATKDQVRDAVRAMYGITGDLTEDEADALAVLAWGVGQVPTCLRSHRNRRRRTTPSPSAARPCAPRRRRTKQSA